LIVFKKFDEEYKSRSRIWCSFPHSRVCNLQC